MCGHCGSGRMCGVCKFVTAILCLLITLTTVAAVLGVWNSHVTVDGWIFGTVAGSIALVTLIVSLMAWYKIYKKLCPCGTKGGCGCGCGGDCDCGGKHDHR